jgi:hypothetical protein
MIAICITVYLFLGLTFIASLAVAASRPVPQVTNAPQVQVAETQFKAEELALHDAA